LIGAETKANVLLYKPRNKLAGTVDLKLRRYLTFIFLFRHSFAFFTFQSLAAVSFLIQAPNLIC
jgi:hypothetical protein